MIDLKASRRYARALFEFTEKSGDWNQIDKDFVRLRELTSQHPEIEHLVVNPTLSHAEKEDFIDKIFGSEVSRTLIHFIKVLIHKRRFQEAGLVQEAFHRLVEKKQGLQEVHVMTPYALTDSLEKKLSKMLEKKLATRIRLRTEIQPSMIGGIILRFEGQELNLSYRHRLDELRQTLVASTNDS